MLRCTFFFMKKGNSHSFVDSVKVLISSGAGGDGASVMSHEHSNEFAGPGGGNGGNGGNVMLRCIRKYSDLQHIKSLGDQVSASAGCPGYAREAHGKRGRDLWLEVPLGTVVSDIDTNEVLFDLAKDGTEVMLLEGGQGGKGNACFANKWYHSPVESTRGLPGNSMLAQIELKCLADCGLIGYPNAGKSSILASVSSSKPMIAPYAFTTLRPYVGVIHDLYGNTCRLADIPGLIEGAYENRGLGHHFLRHVERTKALAFVVDMHETYSPLNADAEENTPPWEVVRLLQCELEYFAPGLSRNAIMIIANKMDLHVDKKGVPLVAKVEELRRRTRLPVFPVSASLGLALGCQHKDTGLEPMLQAMCAHVARATSAEKQKYMLQRASERAELDTMFKSMNNGMYAKEHTHTSQGAMEASSLIDQQLDLLGDSGMGDTSDAFENSVARGKLHQYRDYSMKGRYWTLTRQRGERIPGENWH